MTSPSSEPDDRALAALALAGRQDAYGALMRRHRDAVWRLARGHVGDADEALDITQESFVAAFTGEPGEIKSDIPFAVATNGPAVAGAYGVVDKFNIVIIGKDGNVDYQTKKVIPSSRVRDVIQNSFVVQSSTGR